MSHSYYGIILNVNYLIILKSNGKRKPPNYIEGRRKLPHYLTLEVLIQYHDYKGKSFAPQKISSPAMMQEYIS